MHKEFGVDNVPLQESHLSLALYRSRREVGLQKKALDSTPARRSRRVKRNFLYYSPINITERVTQELLQNIVDRLEFARRVNGNCMIHLTYILYFNCVCFVFFKICPYSENTSTFTTQCTTWSAAIINECCLGESVCAKWLHYGCCVLYGSNKYSIR